ncbi:MAG: hypothetical protein Q8K65_07515, partial [Alphaproteobacteria bacterium]|nr:hypothetical protein [Alphaproteobacteria bacterium]
MTAENARAAQKQTHTINPGILREYDIRGTVGDTLREEDCYFIGRAFGTLVKRRGGKKGVVGFDGRESSVPFSASVMR